MARIQLLTLPSCDVGGTWTDQFAVIVDEFTATTDESRKQWHDFAAGIGAAGVVVTPERVDVVVGHAADKLTVEFDTRDLAADVANLLRARMEQDAGAAVGSWLDSKVERPGGLHPGGPVTGNLR